ncbi:TlpA family protein disulfide reductase [Ectothiorhodospiraceae bacterium 2226]|nr:TlpA family protein disulfide reductase [Ectothiorhodospiraceae bacterium 2226]
MSARFVLLLILVALIGAGGGFAFHQWLTAPPAPLAEAPRSPQAPETRPDFHLPDLSGNMRSADEWDGQVVLVNFWATWCPPCVREIPELVRLQELHHENGLVVLGIAIDEPEAVEAFLADMAVNYPILLGRQGGIALAQEFGNRHGILPYTVVYDRNGRITHTHAGELDLKAAETMVLPLL